MTGVRCVLAAVMVAGLMVLAPQAQAEEAPVGAWGHAPEPTLWRGPAVQLADGRIAAFDTVNPQVQVFDPVGRRWGRPASIGGPSSPVYSPVALQDGTVLLGPRIVNPDDGSHRAVGAPLWNSVNGSATLLADGRVLAAGGCCQDAESLAYIFDPVAGAWSPAASLSDAREGHGAVRLADGRVLLMGGVVGGHVSNTAAVYDPMSDTWSPAAPMADIRYRPTPLLLDDGRVVVAGGIPHGLPRCDVWEIYDPVSGAWSRTAAAPACLNASGVTLLQDGRILGVSAEAADAVSLLYDPDADQWSRAATPRVQRRDLQVWPLEDGSALVMGPPATTDNQGRYRPGSLAELYYPGPVPPAAPTGVASQYQCCQGPHTITWAASSSPDVVGYRIYRAHGYHPLRLVATTGPTETAFVDTPPTASPGYHYAVTAVNTIGESALALEPGPFPWLPGFASATKLADGSIKITWAVKVDGDDRPASFQIYRQAPGVFEELVGEVAAADSGTDAFGHGQFRMQAPDDWAETWYQVRMITQSGADELVGWARPSEQLTPPRLEATSAPDGVHLRWTPADDAVSPTAFRIYRGSTRFDLSLLEEVSGTQTAFLDASAEPLQEYWYAVSMVGERWEGHLSDPVRGAVPMILDLNSAAAQGVGAPVALEDGASYRVTSSGTYRWSALGLADAECSKVMWSNDWVRHRFDNAVGRDLLDIRLNGQATNWTSAKPGASCDAVGHTYTTTITPTVTAPLHAVIDDNVHEDNEGTLTLTIERLG